MSAIEVKNLVKKFHGQTVLHGIDLEVKPGEVVAVIGPSGSGKTTLLRSINLLEQPEAGTITVGDITIDTARSLSQQKSLIRQLRQHVGFVFQNFNLFPHRTVLENIIEGPVIVKGEPKEEATARARELLAKVGLAGKETSYPRRLSGGQQQRVAIARALAMRPEVILFDEPTSALDPELVGESEHHSSAGAGKAHDGDCDARNELCPGCCGPGDFYGPGADSRAGGSKSVICRSPAASHPTVPREVSAAIIRKNQPRRFTCRGGTPFQA